MVCDADIYIRVTLKGLSAVVETITIYRTGTFIKCSHLFGAFLDFVNYSSGQNVNINRMFFNKYEIFLNSNQALN